MRECVSCTRYDIYYDTQNEEEHWSEKLIWPTPTTPLLRPPPRWNWIELSLGYTSLIQLELFAYSNRTARHEKMKANRITRNEKKNIYIKKENWIYVNGVQYIYISWNNVFCITKTQTKANVFSWCCCWLKMSWTKETWFLFSFLCFFFWVKKRRIFFTWIDRMVNGRFHWKYLRLMCFHLTLDAIMSKGTRKPMWKIEISHEWIEGDREREQENERTNEQRRARARDGKFDSI